jgi:hypothetical protein
MPEHAFVPVLTRRRAVWELATGERPYRNLNAARILHRVLLSQGRPALPTCELRAGHVARSPGRACRPTGSCAAPCMRPGS